MSTLLSGRLTDPSAPLGWPLTLLLIALVGTAIAFAARQRPGLSFAAGLLAWAAIAAVIGQAWRDAPAATAPLVTASGIALIGFIAWICAPGYEASRRRGKWLPALVLALACGGFGVVAASDFLVLTVWLGVIGAANYALTLAVAPQRRALRWLLAGEALALVSATAALLFLGRAELGPGGLAAPLAQAGLVLVSAHLLLRIGLAVYSLGVAAQARALGPELALGALALPTLLSTHAYIVSKFAPVLPPEFLVGLTIFGGTLTIAGALLFVGARARGSRLAWLGASLSGVALLVAGSGGAEPGGEIFAALIFVPFAAIIAGSSITSSLEGARDVGAPVGFAGIMELGLTLAALGVIGLPPFAGFWPRLLLMDAAVRSGNFALPAALILASLLLAYGLVRAGAGLREPGTLRPAPVRALEVAAFGLLLGVSLAAGLTPRLNRDQPLQAGRAEPGPPLANATEAR
jgi:multicomponent Na+:H+ antiporter subunit D